MFGEKNTFYGNTKTYEDSFMEKLEKWRLRNLLLFPAGIQLKVGKGEIGRVLNNLQEAAV